MNINEVTISGRIESGFTFETENYNEKFYKFTIYIERTSGSADLIPVIVSERLIDVNMDCIGRYVSIKGQFRSHNVHDSKTGKASLLLYVFPFQIELIDRCEFVNEIALEGFVCKKPTFRNTPFGRSISDLIMAVNRQYSKSDYIPCICWGRNAIFASNMNVGDQVHIDGRIQSREYEKDGHTHVAFEVSVNLIEKTS